jgi:hypothetical protein
VRPIQDKVLNLSDQRLDLVDEGVVLDALFMNGFVSSEHWPGFQEGSDLGILRAAVYFGWNGLGIINRHCFRSLLSDMPRVTFRVVGDLAICCNFGKPDPAHMKECILKAGCITAGEELFGLGRIAPSVEAVGQPKLEVEQTVFRCGSNCDGLRSP